MFSGGKVWCQIVFLDNQRLCREMCLVKSCITVKADSRCCSTCFCDTALEISIYISIFLTRTNTTCLIMKWHIQAVPPTHQGWAFQSFCLHRYAKDESSKFSSALGGGGSTHLCGFLFLYAFRHKYWHALEETVLIMEILSSFTYPHVVPNLYDFLLWNNKRWFF